MDREFVMFKIYGTDPVTLGFQPFHHMSADKTTCAVYENSLCLFSYRELRMPDRVEMRLKYRRPGGIRSRIRP